MIALKIQAIGQIIVMAVALWAAVAKLIIPIALPAMAAADPNNQTMVITDEMTQDDLDVQQKQKEAAENIVDYVVETKKQNQLLVDATKKLADAMEEKHKLSEQATALEHKLNADEQKLNQVAAKGADTKAAVGDNLLDWITDYEKAKQLQKETNKPILVDFSPDWCEECQYIKKNIFQNGRIAKKLASEYVPITLGRGPTSLLLGVTEFPTVVVVYPDGHTKKITGLNRFTTPIEFERLLHNGV